jgi:hypothetical protein
MMEKPTGTIELVTADAQSGHAKIDVSWAGGNHVKGELDVAVCS